MKRIPLFIAMMTLLLTLFGAANFAADDAEGGAAIPRFEQVAPGLYRGGQPSPAGFVFLKWRGIRTVINLREELDERALAEGLGFKYFHIPLDVGDPVSENQSETDHDAVIEYRNPVGSINAGFFHAAPSTKRS